MLARRALLDDPAVLHHDRSVGHVGDDAHVVRDQHDARVDARAQVAHELEDLGLDRDVERRRRLVGDEQLRVAGQRLRDHRALPLTAGELVRVGVEPASRGPGSRPAAAARARASRASAGPIVEVRAQRLDDLEADRVDRVQRGHRLLEDHRDLLAADLGAASCDGMPISSRSPSLALPRGPAVRREQAEEGHRATASCRSRTRRRWRAPRRGGRRSSRRSRPGTTCPST